MTWRPGPYSCLTILVLARTAMGFQFQSVGSLSPFLIDDLGIGFAALGTLIGMFMLPGVFVSMPSGALSRWLSDRKIALLGLMSMVVGGALFAAAGDVSTAVAGRIVSGAGAVMLNVVLAKMVAEWFEEEQQIVAMSFLVTSWPLGIGLALIVEPALAEAASWEVAAGAAAVLCGIALALLWVAYRDPPEARGAPSDAAGAALSMREVWLVSLVGWMWMLYNVGYILVVSFTPTYLSETGASPVAAGAITSVATWTLIGAIPLGGFLVARTGGDRTWMLASFVAMGAAMLALPFTSPLVAVTIIGLAAGPPAGALMAAASSVLRPRNRGIGMGIYFTWYYIGMTALPSVAGYLRDVTGDPANIFFLGAAIMGATAAILIVFQLSLTRKPAMPDAVGPV